MTEYIKKQVKTLKQTKKACWFVAGKDKTGKTTGAFGKPVTSAAKTLKEQGVKSVTFKVAVQLTGQIITVFGKDEDVLKAAERHMLPWLRRGGVTQYTLELSTADAPDEDAEDDTDQIGQATETPDESDQADATEAQVQAPTDAEIAEPAAPEHTPRTLRLGDRLSNEFGTFANRIADVDMPQPVLQSQITNLLNAITALGDADPDTQEAMTLRALLDVRPSRVLEVSQLEPDPPEPGFFGVDLGALSDQPITDDDIARALKLDLQDLAAQQGQDLNADFMQTDRLQGWAESVLAASDPLERIGAVKAALAKSFADGQAGRAFDLDGALTRRDQALERLGPFLGTVDQSMRAIDRAISGLVAAVDQQLSPAALSDQDVLLLVSAKNIAKRMQAHRAGIVQTLRIIRRDAANYPFGTQTSDQITAPLDALLGDSTIAHLDDSIATVGLGSGLIQTALNDVREAGRTCFDAP